jgi:hypothetical protein
MREVDWVKEVISPKTCELIHNKTQENSSAEQALRSCLVKVDSSVLKCIIHRVLWWIHLLHPIPLSHPIHSTPQYSPLCPTVWHTGIKPISFGRKLRANNRPQPEVIRIKICSSIITRSQTKITVSIKIIKQLVLFSQKKQLILPVLFPHISE